MQHGYSQTPSSTVPEAVSHDAHASADKQRVMSKLRTNSFFFSIADTFKFLAGIGMMTGMAALMPTMMNVITSGTFSVFSLSSLSALGTAIIGAPAFGIIVAAAACTAVAIGSQYISQRFFQSGNYDALEINAQHTAKYLAKEIQKTHALEHDCGRADGKQWTQVIKEESLAQQQAR